MFSHVESCKIGKQTIKSYCDQKGIPLSTFHYWAKKYRKEFSKDEVSEDVPGFIPVQVQSDPGANQERVPGQLHFLFPNGIQVMCPENIDHNVLKTLLNS